MWRSSIRRGGSCPTPWRGCCGRALSWMAADHGVSEALYLRDPDGNGVELYWDRPQSAWPRTAQGELAMYTRPLDLDGLLSASESPTE